MLESAADLDGHSLVAELKARQQNSSTEAFRNRWWGRENGCPLDPRSRPAKTYASSTANQQLLSEGSGVANQSDSCEGTCVERTWIGHVDDANAIGYLRCWS